MNIDAFLVFSYLILTLILGIYWSRNIKDISDYALGGKNFPTFVLAATIIATHASASGFFLDVTKSYEDGIYKLLATTGQTFRLLFTAYFIAPRMVEFSGKLSVADMMGDLYGKKIRIFSSLPIFLVTAGFVAVQIKVLSSTLEYFTEISKFECIILTSIIVLPYSIFGGVRAVIFTHVIQFITFAIAIPLIFLIVYSHLELPSNAINSKLLINHLLNLDIDKRGYYIVLFTYLAIPSLGPPIVQRLLMAKNTNQMLESYKISAFSLLFFLILFNFLGAMIFVSNPNLEPNLVMGYLIDQFTYPGLKGLFLIAIIALAMSTADSNLNSGAVSFSHDFCKPLGLFNNYSELTISKIFSVVIGILAVILAVKFQDLISLILFVHNFYAPIITVPLLLAIFGFRTSTKSVIVGILFGISTVLCWDYVRDILGISKQIDSFIPGMLAHLFGLVFTHILIDKKITQINFLYPLLSRVYEYIYSIFNKNNFNNLFASNIRQSDHLFNSIALYINILYFVSFLYFGKISSKEILILVYIISLSLIMVYLNFLVFNSVFIREIIYYFVCIFSLPFSSIFLFLYSDFSEEMILLVTVSFAIMPVIMSIFLAFSGMLIGLILALFAYYNIYDFSHLDFHTIIKNDLLILVGIVIFMVSVFISRKTFIDFEKILKSNKNLILDNVHLDQKRIKAEFDAIKIKDLKNEIMNNFSHEIRTPLQKLKANLEIIQITKSFDIEIIDKLKTSFEYLEKYLLRIVELSTYQKREDQNKIEKIKLLDILNNITNSYRKYIDIRVLKEDQFNSYEIYFDNAKINKIIEEIIENSIIHSSAKLIDIKLSQEIFESNKYIKLVFKDLPTDNTKKLEMNESDINKIFRPFEILGDGKSGYRGLGLSIVQEIVSSNNGRVFAELEKYNDESIEKSLKLTLLLNINPPLDHIEHQQKITEGFPNKKLNILLIDDEREVLESIGMIIEMLGHHVTKIDYGKEAVEIIQNEFSNFDVIMIDMMMPDMSGPEVLKAVQDEIKTKNIKIVIQSGIASENDLNNEIKDIEIHGFIRKPYGVDTIKKVISQLISSK